MALIGTIFVLDSSSSTPTTATTTAITTGTTTAADATTTTAAATDAPSDPGALWAPYSGAFPGAHIADPPPAWFLPHHEDATYTSYTEYSDDGLGIGTVVARIDPTTGAESWRTEPRHGRKHLIATAAGVLVLNCTEHDRRGADVRVEAFDANDGSSRAATLDLRSECPLAAYGDDLIVIGSAGVTSHVARVSLTTGERLAQSDDYDNLRVFDAVADALVVRFGEGDLGLLALDDLRLVARTEIGNANPVGVADDSVYVADETTVRRYDRSLRAGPEITLGRTESTNVGEYATGLSVAVGESGVWWQVGHLSWVEAGWTPLDLSSRQRLGVFSAEVTRAAMGIGVGLRVGPDELAYGAHAGIAVVPFDLDPNGTMRLTDAPELPAEIRDADATVVEQYLTEMCATNADDPEIGGPEIVGFVCGSLRSR